MSDEQPTPEAPNAAPPPLPTAPRKSWLSRAAGGIMQDLTHYACASHCCLPPDSWQERTETPPPPAPGKGR